MKKSTVTQCLLNFVIFNVVISKRHGSDTEVSDKIVGGHKIPIEMVPYQVYMKLKKGDNFQICGGSIISEKHVLTAAHCVEDATEVIMKTGTADPDSGGTEYVSTSFIMHPSYETKSVYYDVAVVNFPKGIKIEGETTKIIRLVKEDTTLPVGDKLVVTGWGITSEDAETRSEHLMAVEVPIVSNKLCKAMIPIKPPMDFCAGYREGGRDSCQGDSGGPAVLKELGIQIGIISVGIGCARKNLPGMYTNIADPGVRSFIKKNSGV